MKKVFLFSGVWLGICLCFLFGDHFLMQSKSIVVENQIKLSVATEAGFQDENFYACVLSAASQPEGTVLTNEQLSSITEVVCEKSGVTNIVGVEKLTSLRNLNLNENNITSVNLSNNKNLQMLNLTFNQLSTIDVSNNTELQGLYLNSNHLTVIDVSKNLKLLDLNLNNNNLSNIDVSNNTMLQYVLFSGNDLNSLDLSSNIKLEHIYASSNQITNLKLPVTTTVTRLDLNDNNLSSIDVSNFINLDYLIVSANKLSSLDLSKNTNLTKLYASSNKINEIDLKNNLKLFDLDLSYNNIEVIDLSKLSSLDYLNLSVNGLKGIDVSNLIHLTKIYISSNDLETIDLSKNNNLKEINVVFNNFDNLVINNSSIVEYMVIENDWIGNYDFSKFTNLSKLDVVYYQVLPVYGTSIEKSKILDWVPSNIVVNNYTFQKNFIGSAVLEEDTVEGSIGSYFRLRLVSESADNTDVSNFDGIQKFTGWYEVRFMQLTSDKYVIDDVNNKIDVGGDSDEVILENIKADWDSKIEISGDILKLSYNGVMFKQFTLLRTSNPKTGDILIGMIIFLAILGATASIFIYREKLVNKI